MKGTCQILKSPRSATDAADWRPSESVSRRGAGGSSALEADSEEEEEADNDTAEVSGRLAWPADGF
jgi:hypothetical protein